MFQTQIIESYHGYKNLKIERMINQLAQNYCDAKPFLTLVDIVLAPLHYKPRFVYFQPTLKTL